jgi:hypothetical protein
MCPINLEPGVAQLLGKSPQLASARDRGMIIEIHRMNIAAGFTLETDGDDLAGLAIMPETGGIGHVDEFIFDDRFGHLERRGNDFLQHG